MWYNTASCNFILRWYKLSLALILFYFFIMKTFNVEFTLWLKKSTLTWTVTFELCKLKQQASKPIRYLAYFMCFLLQATACATVLTCTVTDAYYITWKSHHARETVITLMDNYDKKPHPFLSNRHREHNKKSSFVKGFCVSSSETVMLYAY